MRKVAVPAQRCQNAQISAPEPAFCFSLADLAHCQSYLVEMSQLLQSMDVLHRTYSAPAINAIQVSQGRLLLAS